MMFSIFCILVFDCRGCGGYKIMNDTRSRLWWAFFEVINFGEGYTVLGTRSHLTNCDV